MYKVLLDENLPVKIKFRLQDTCEIYTVKDMAWNALENGELISAMLKDGFDYLITSDRNLQHQQNIDAYSISFIVLNIQDNNYETILPLIDKVKLILVEKEKLKLTVIS